MKLGPETIESIEHLKAKKESIADLAEQISGIIEEFPIDYHILWEDETTKFEAFRYSFGWSITASFYDKIEQTANGFWPWSKPVVIDTYLKFSRIGFVHIYNDEMTKYNGMRFSIRCAEPKDATAMITSFYNKLLS